MNSDNYMLDVIVPCYNVEKYVGFALDSLLEQTFSEFRIIVIDDASTDHTWDILRDYEKKDERICLYRNRENCGIAYTRNYGLDLAKSKYIAFMDADDIALPDRLKKQIAFLEKHPEIGAVSGHYRRIDYEGKVFGKRMCKKYDSDEIRIHFLFSDIFYNAIAMFRREIVEDHQLRYNVKDKIAEDYRFWCMFSGVSQMYVLPEVLYYYRYNSEGLTETFKYSEEKIASLNDIHKYMLSEFEVDLCPYDEQIWLGALNGYITDDEYKELKRIIMLVYKQIETKANKKMGKCFYKCGSNLLFNLWRDSVRKNDCVNKLYMMYRKIVYDDQN